MKHSTRHFAGMASCWVGLVLLMTNAIDYLSATAFVPDAWSLLGIAFAAVGLFVGRKSGARKRGK